MMIMNIGTLAAGGFPVRRLPGDGLAAYPHLARRVPQDVGYRLPEVEVVELLSIRNAEHDEIRPGLDGLLDDGGPNVAGLQDLSVDVLIPLFSRTLGLVEHRIGLLTFFDQVCVQRKRTADLHDVDGIDPSLRALGHHAGQRDRRHVGWIPVDRYEDLFWFQHRATRCDRFGDLSLPRSARPLGVGRRAIYCTGSAKSRAFCKGGSVVGQPSKTTPRLIGAIRREGRSSGAG